MLKFKNLFSKVFFFWIFFFKKKAVRFFCVRKKTRKSVFSALFHGSSRSRTYIKVKLKIIYILLILLCKIARSLLIYFFFANFFNPCEYFWRVYLIKRYVDFSHFFFRFRWLILFVIISISKYW